MKLLKKIACVVAASVISTAVYADTLKVVNNVPNSKIYALCGDSKLKTTVLTEGQSNTAKWTTLYYAMGGKSTFKCEFYNDLPVKKSIGTVTIQLEPGYAPKKGKITDAPIITDPSYHVTGMTPGVFVSDATVTLTKS